MAGLLSYSVGGLGILLVGAIESFSSFFPSPELSSFRSFSVFAVSSLSLVDSVISLIYNHGAGDEVGFSLQLCSFAVSSLFLLYALAGIASSSGRFLSGIPSQILDLVAFFALVAEFLLFRFQFKDSTGVENQYYDLVLVPVAVSAAATLICASLPESPLPRLIRGLGITLQGTWFVQMGFSFFSTAISHGCFLRQRSRGDYTVQCKGHAEYHRGRAIATLQFNGHLALLVLTSMAIYAAAVSGRDDRRPRKYEPLSEMQRLDSSARFTLDSDEEEDSEITNSATMPHSSGINGGAH